MNKETVLNTFVFNPECNGGESLSVTTKIVESRGDKIPLQEITLQSYCNSASFNINFYLTPDMLRKMANELEKACIANSIEL